MPPKDSKNIRPPHIPFSWRRLEINGGRVDTNPLVRLTLSPRSSGYADAQIDDYGGRPRRRYPWRPGVQLALRARFSHPAGELRGTAGFGFWNAPFGDPSTRWPALPRAAWFFFTSPPGDLPLNPEGAGQGWFASTVDATRPAALLLAPTAPLVVLLNRWPRFRQAVWPRIQRALGMSYAPLNRVDLTSWHTYQLSWRPDGCRFQVDGQVVLDTDQSPRGPLGFVCWLDNQYLAVTPTASIAAGTLPTTQSQWLEIADLQLSADS